MMEQFHFLRPHWLFLLPLAAGLVWAIMRRNDSQRKWRKLLAPHLLKALLVNQQSGKHIRPITLLAIIFLLGIVALAGPTWHQQPSPFAQDSASLVIVLKVTPSMLTEDVQPSRLQRAVQKIQDVLAQRTGTRTALIAYSGSAHLVMPLTRDASIINSFASELHPNILPRDGDNPSAALTLAAKQLFDAGEKGSVLWIGDALAAAEVSRLRAEERSSIASLVMLGTVGQDPDSQEHRELKKAASTLRAKLEFITPDERDIDVITAHVERDFISVLDTEEGVHWQDEGYWLLFPLIMLALFWFRSGWVIKYQ